MIEFRDLSIRRGRTELIGGATFTIPRGAAVGIIGRNGCGKSSLLSLFTGGLAADSGELDVPRALTLAHVSQQEPWGKRGALDTVLDGDVELRRIEADLATAEARDDGNAIAHAHGRLDEVDGYAAHARAASILLGLGFTEAQLTLAVDEFSGGWRMRLNLARALIARSDLLLLDEPTNHLDLDAVLWLETWLSSYAGTLLVISHDRDFLDRITDHIAHIESQTIRLYKGDFSAFERQRAEILAQNRALFDRQQKRIAQIQGFVDRFRAQATKARQAQSRLKTLARMERIELAHVDRPFSFSIPEPQKLPNPLLRLDQVAAGYGEHIVIDEVRANLTPGSRIGLVGLNGAGKSTLIKLIAGQLPPLSGAREESRGLNVGYFAQHQLDQLDLREGPLTHLRRIAPKEREQVLRDYLGGFGFPGEMADTACQTFSGGEKARLVLAVLLWPAPNLLLLDEPTNHLDLDMRDALTRALQDFPGALVTVSHDRHLLDATTDELWLVHAGEVSVFSGDLDDYRDWLMKAARDNNAQQKAATKRALVANTVTHLPSNPSDRKSERKAAAQARAQQQPLKKAADKLEREVEALTQASEIVQNRLADTSVYEENRKSELTELLQEQAKVAAALGDAEAKWLEVLERLDEAQAN
jgi:ATP-binding cassette, subfamily F, member 3